MHTQRRGVDETMNLIHISYGRSGVGGGDAGECHIVATTTTTTLRNAFYCSGALSWIRQRTRSHAGVDDSAK